MWTRQKKTLPQKLMNTFNKLLIGAPIIIVVLTSCHRNDDTDDYCARLLDTSDMNLYKFDPFTESDWKAMPYSEKLEKRQVPNDVLSQMSTKELFYQFVTCDLSHNTYMFNIALNGFRRTSESLNTMQTLIKQPDVGSFLIDMIHTVDITKINTSDCFHLFHCAQYILVQQEVIDTFDDLDMLVDALMLLEENILHASNFNPNEWGVPFSLTAPTYGFGMIMMKYNYMPFIQLMESNEDVAKFMNLTMNLDMNILSLINEYMVNFYFQN